MRFRSSIARFVVCAASLVLVASCGAISNPQDPDTAAMPKSVGLLVVESDFGGSSAVEAIDSDTHATVERHGLSYDGDPEIRRLVDPSGTEHIFIVGRKSSTLTEIDRSGVPLRTISVVDPAGTPGGDPVAADPYDVAIAPDGNLWVTRYFLSTLLVLSPDGQRVGTVDLTPFADEDGLPEMTAIAIVDGIAYVALARLSTGTGGNYPAPSGYSSIVAIDTRTQPWTPTEWVQLPTPTPRERFRHAIYAPSSELWISCLGAPRSNPEVPGALVKIDLAATSQADRAKIVLDGRHFTIGSKRFKGFVNGYDILDSERGFAVLASLETVDNPTSVVEFNPTTGQIVSNVWYGRDQFDLWDLALADDRLIVVDRNRNDPALVFLDASDGSVIEPRFSTHLPAVELLLLRSQP